MKRLALAPIRLYQRFISPLKGVPTCRFIPTCSTYAIEAVHAQGVLKGFFLAMWRVLRCNPLCRGGYDPVPSPRAARLECNHGSG